MKYHNLSNKELFNEILNAQLPSGAFPSIACLPNEDIIDENSFTTALVIDVLSNFKENPVIEMACNKAIDYLLQCENPKGSGMFGFYPVNLRPKWIKEFLPPDADDTALCALALFRNGYWNRNQLCNQVKILERYRLKQKPIGMAWFKNGVFPTWLDRNRMNNPIDICVNINIATLMGEAKLDVTYSDPIFEMLESAFNWIGNNTQRLQQTMPYYPHPLELFYALQRAVDVGLDKAFAPLEYVKKLLWNYDINPHTPICSSIGHGIVWKSPLLQYTRNYHINSFIKNS